ncbi:MAG: S8 family serine peptidase [Bacteroidia bacterium]
MKFLVNKSVFCLLLSFGINLSCYSQYIYRIYFKDKKGSEYNPFEYLHPKAIERRIIHGLDLCDSSDFPINENYLTKVTQLSDSIKGYSRWMNAAFIYASESNIELIRCLPFVSKIETVIPVKGSTVCNLESVLNFDTSVTERQKNLLGAQLDRMNGKLFKNNNLDGNGVIIAIIDVGFKTYNTNPAFENIRIRNGIIGTYDFVKKRTNTNIGMMHGTNVFSCIGGQIEGYQIGLATGAEFLLARTESYTEFFNEEEYWLMAAEWADKKGADIINSSLGYTNQRYLPENMDGRSTFVSKAAQIAVNKGILVVSAAGNEGSGKWKRVAAPGDAEGVLTVGGIDPTTGIHSDFSSFGPSWDKRLKPEVCAYGTAVVSSRYGLTVGDGTSFSSPLVAGFAACVKQLYPGLRNTDLKELICHSGDLWPYYDYAHGYGVPQPFFLFKDTLENKPTLSIIEDKYDVTIYPIEWDTALTKDSNVYWDSSFVEHTLLDSTFVMKDSMSGLDSSLIKVIDTFKETISSINHRELNLYKTKFPDYLFYHIKNKKGYIDKYYVMDLKDDENGSVSISKDITDKPFSIEFFYKGYYKELIIKE